MQPNQEALLRFLLGKPLDQVARKTQVPAQELETWQRRFLQGGQRGLRTKTDPEERELTLAKAKLADLMMRPELAEVLIEKRGS